MRAELSRSSSGRGRVRVSLEQRAPGAFGHEARARSKIQNKPTIDTGNPRIIFAGRIVLCRTVAAERRFLTDALFQHQSKYKEKRYRFLKVYVENRDCKKSTNDIQGPFFCKKCKIQQNFEANQISPPNGISTTGRSIGRKVTIQLVLLQA
jgi:hypothetical protein